MTKINQTFKILLIVISSCAGEQGGFDSEQQSGQAVGVGEDSTIATVVDGRPVEQVLCQDGPTVIESRGNGDFSRQFAYICENGSTNQVFKDIVMSSYEGGELAQVQTLHKVTSPLYVTEFAFAFAIKVPLVDPSQFADYRAHDIFAEGISTDSSNLVINVASRDSFPGRGSIESVVLDYDLKTAHGAAIFDKRQTEFNTYLLVEDNRDVVVSTEHLVDVETNPSYHLSNGLTIGVTAGDGYSYIIFITELIIKDRIDPVRLEKALLDLNQEVSKMLYEHITNTEI
ncbi:hypothetical protein [Pseudobacteriovorax antillogorgiicola]|uniref:Uncharacterized protein n=1 Tax=Pseudobacteriovorax antillogorgiicola TaxID=1513793 RepID=A0A1Y6BT55_9BACT|nr:hypothetical protein [Pseudobacteriovorax antillogorgiicola]TCS54528.1 hypothetical protein EDD56_10641 [Pseudobacteriovorax antillogorgiicola]SMF18760.1 hypothetical protein SAMN06296036_106202 [Pseudobacteriovorax antillogorgiicola]